MADAGRFSLRVTILPRVLAAKGANAEEVESWPASGGRDYFAARDRLDAGETITQGIRQATGTLKLRIRGRAITVEASDRLQKKVSGELFHITGVVRDEAEDETILTCERVNPQTVAQ